MSCGVFSGTYTTPDTNVTDIELICRGSNPAYTGSTWFEYWSQLNSKICTNEFTNILYGAQNLSGLRTYDHFQLQRIRDDMSNVFATYQQLHPITHVGDQNYNAFQEILTNTCLNIPGACNDFIDSFCTGCTREEIAADNVLLSYCGCDAPAPPSQYNITIPCDPLCNRIDTMQNIDTTTGETLKCVNDVCVIDDISITASNTTLSGGIVFAQMCPCKANCTCIIGGVSVNNTLAEVGLTSSALFDIACGSNSTCYQTDPTTQQLVPIVCPKTASFQFLADPVRVNNYTIFLIIAITLVIIIAVIIIYIYNSD